MTEKQGAEAVHDGIVLTLSTDRHVYQPGEIVVAEARVENTSSLPISYALGHIGDPDIYVALTQTPYGSGVELHEKGREFWAVLPVALAYTLVPGQSITREVVWDQHLPAHPESIQAPAGSYSIQAIFRSNGPFTLTATVAIEITERGS